jgi:hypothetical protein
VTHHQPRKGSIVSVRAVFEPNRLERTSLAAAYERVVPVIRRATPMVTKAECADKTVPSPSRRSI